MVCSRCKNDKNKNEFYISCPDWCKQCRYTYGKENRHKYRKRDKEYAKQYRKNFPEKTKAIDRNSKLKSLYGLTSEKVETMRIAQHGLCAICLQPAKLVIDHNHKTGKVRELLCQGCNVGIGSFGENILAIEQAIRYLKKHNNSE